jgi:hypothetical protein
MTRKSLRELPLGMPRKWKDNIKIGLREMVCEGRR